MKTTRFVNYFTIILILLQSFSTVANSLDFHANDPQHLQQEHQHSDDHINNADNVTIADQLNDNKSPTANQHNPADCHHCGHCNGTHVQWVGHYAVQNYDLAQHSHQFHYLRAVIDAPVNQLLRPPKA
jgi:hypothetical protein